MFFSIAEQLFRGRWPRSALGRRARAGSYLDLFCLQGWTSLAVASGASVNEKAPV